MRCAVNLWLAIRCGISSHMPSALSVGDAVTSPAPEATEDQWRALIWAFVCWITEGGPEPFAALQAAKREMERAKG